MAMFSFPEHVPEFCWRVFMRMRAYARDDAIGGTMEDSDRESRVNCIDVLQVIVVSICDNYISTIASIDVEDFPVTCDGSRFNISPSHPDLGPRKHQNRRTPIE